MKVTLGKAERQALWEQIYAKAPDYFSPGICDKWIKNLTVLSMDERLIVLGARTDFTRDWVESRYRGMLEDVAAEALGTMRSIRIQTVPEDVQVKEARESLEEAMHPEANKKAKRSAKERGSYLPDEERPEQQTLDYDDPVRLRQFITPDGASIAAEPDYPPYGATPSAGSLDTSEIDMHLIAPGDSSSLNPKYTFETFVTGGSNRFAHAAALAVAEKPGKVYNPFFMYGGVGLGKTHLMHAIGNSVLAAHPEMRVLYVSSEQFTNEIIQSIQKGQAETFRQKYRNIDVLLVDDIQFISGKTSTQEEFFHTFNTLYNSQKQIILSSDRPPKEVQKLEERLRSRFEWGLIADIQKPDLETRIAILKNRAILDGYDVPNDVMVYIATRIDSNIRELEGALTRVVAYASLEGTEVTTATVARALKDVLPQGASKEITLESIDHVVAHYYGLTTDDLHAKKRSRRIAYPRQVAMYLCRELTDTSLPQIGAFFGGRDHTTVLHACDKIAREKESNKKLAEAIAELIETIQK